MCAHTHGALLLPSFENALTGPPAMPTAASRASSMSVTASVVAPRLGVHLLPSAATAPRVGRATDGGGPSHGSVCL